MGGSRLVIGLDFGTDSVRGILVGCGDGRIRSESEFRYPRWRDRLHCSEACSRFRQHPQDHLEGLAHVLRELTAGVAAGDVLGIGLDTTGSTVCPVDRRGVPLALLPEFAGDPDAMFYLWKDHSALAEADEINRVAARWPEDFRRHTGGRYSCEWFWSKILWAIRHAPRVAAAAFSWVEHSDWLVGELTGRSDPLAMTRNVCAAGHKALWHPDWGGLPPAEFLAEIDPGLGDLRRRLGSRTVTADHPCGTLSPRWADLCGLGTHTVVAGGQLDAHAGAVGAGIEPGKLVKVVGTSTCDIAVSRPMGRCVPGICGQIPGSVLPGLVGLEAGQASFGDVYGWFQRFLNSFGQDIAIAEIERRASRLPPGEPSRVFALDWFNGRRSPDADERLTGALFGLDLGTTPEMVFRALVESTCCGARRIVERFLENGLDIRTIVAVGGIARKSPYVMQTLADVLARPVGVLDSPQACALGSAMNAAAAAGCFPDLAAAVRALDPGCDRTYRPRQACAAAAESTYRRYLRAARLAEDLARE